MAERIARHRAERPEGWSTVEEPLELSAAIRSVAAADCLVVDCLSLWVANGGDGAVPAVRAGLTIAVTNEVGLGIVPDNALARRFRDLQGGLNQRLAAIAPRVVMMVAGIPIAVKSP
jgi:adenosylcobinamide kinase/adenosylcobinamide-phosphate guanylyltransferase